MHKRGWFRHVLDSHEFKDAYLFYRFLQDEAPSADLQPSRGGHGPAGPRVDANEWSFAPHTAHNSLVLDLRLARQLEQEASLTGADGPPRSLRLLRRRVERAFESMEGWDFERRVRIGPSTVTTHTRRKPRGDFTRRRMCTTIDAPASTFVRDLLHFRRRRRREPLFKGAAVVQPTLNGEQNVWEDRDSAASAAFAAFPARDAAARGSAGRSCGARSAKGSSRPAGSPLSADRVASASTESGRDGREGAARRGPTETGGSGADDAPGAGGKAFAAGGGGGDAGVSERGGEEGGEGGGGSKAADGGGCGGLPIDRSLERFGTRIAYRTVHSPSSMFQPREACVLQDAFRCAQSGDACHVYYEISVKHALALGSEGHVTAEVLLLACLCRPSNGGCELTVISQVAPRASVPAWVASMVSGSGLFGGLEPFSAAVSPAEALEPVPVDGSASGGARDPQGKAVGIEDFELLAVLGRGGYSKVMQVRHRESGRVYAVKVLEKSELRRRRQVERTRTERRILAGVRHPYIVRLHYAFQSSEKLYMVMDFAQGGDMFALLRRKARLSAKQAAVYVAEIALALQALHSHDIVYRDLKPENVLIAGDGHVQLTDFGLSRDFDSRPPRPQDVALRPDGVVKVTRSFCGTEQYMAPEVLLQSGHGKGVDWWCLGLLLHEMLSGKHPFQGRSHAETLQNMVYHEPKMHARVPPAGADLARRLLTKDPSQRIASSALGALELRAHPFFAHLDWEDVERKEWPAPLKPRLRSDTDLKYFEAQFTSEAPRESMLASKKAERRGSGLLGLLGFGWESAGRARSADNAEYEHFTYVADGGATGAGAPGEGGEEGGEEGAEEEAEGSG